MNRDEQINAWLDGSLNAEDTEAFEREMEADPMLAEDVNRLLENDTQLRAAFPMEPANDALLRKTGLAEAQVIDFASAKAKRTEQVIPQASRWRWPLGGAIAASLLAVIVAAPWGSAPGSDGLQTALATSPSAVARPIGGGRTATPMLSFVARDGRYCREFLLQGGKGEETGIACNQNGQWKVETLVKGGNAPVDPSEISTAGTETDDPLAESYRKLGASDPLSADKEKQLISNSWK